MSLQSLNRSLDLIELLAASPGGLTLSALAEALSLPVSTVYRLASDLAAKGYAVKNPGTGCYTIGPAFLGLTRSFRPYLELKIEARPFLMELNRQTRLPVSLAVRQDRELRLIDRVGASFLEGGDFIAGQLRSFFTTALGKALLFDATSREIQNFLKEKGSSRIPGEAPQESFPREIEASRKRGWARDGENEGPGGLQGIAAPLYGRGNRLIASVGINWRRADSPVLRAEELAPALCRSAAGISRRLQD